MLEYQIKESGKNCKEIQKETITSLRWHIGIGVAVFGILFGTVIYLLEQNQGQSQKVRERIEKILIEKTNLPPVTDTQSPSTFSQ
jgi:hypothetical protein